MPFVVQAIASRPLCKQEDVTNRRRSTRGLNPQEDRAPRAPVDILGPIQHRIVERSKRMIGIVRRVHFRRHRVPFGDHGRRATLDVLFLRLGLSGDDQPDRQADAEHRCLSMVRPSGGRESPQLRPPALRRPAETHCLVQRERVSRRLQRRSWHEFPSRELGVRPVECVFKAGDG